MTLSIAYGHQLPLQRLRLQQNIDKARKSGVQVLDEEVIYKYKLSKQNTKQVSSKGQQMLYLQDDEAYEQLMEDYNDKGWNESMLNKLNSTSSPHTLLNPSYYDEKDRRRVKTPIEPIEELK